jgi:hydroxymethylpyrimidine pyrophosphatase-like HAD family hydrolase
VTATRIRLLLADVDGTLVTQDKLLTDRAIEAVHHLHDAGIRFAVTSGRPPRGMAMLVEPLGLQTPIAAFNGGLIVDPDMTVLEQRVIPRDLLVPIADLLGSYGLDVWVYRGADWYVPDPEGPHVAREAWTVKFQPKVMPRIEDVTDNVAKLVGVSDDHDAVAKAWSAAHDRFGDDVTAAASQPCVRGASAAPRACAPSAPRPSGSGGRRGPAGPRRARGRPTGRAAVPASRRQGRGRPRPR